jgi:hypothetical protein
MSTDRRRSTKTIRVFAMRMATTDVSMPCAKSGSPPEKGVT